MTTALVFRRAAGLALLGLASWPLTASAQTGGTTATGGSFNTGGTITTGGAGGTGGTGGGDTFEVLPRNLVEPDDRASVRDVKPFWINYDDCINEVEFVFEIDRVDNGDRVKAFVGEGTCLKKSANCALVFDRDVGGTNYTVSIPAVDFVGSQDSDYNAPGDGTVENCESNHDLALTLTFVIFDGDSTDPLASGTFSESFGVDMVGPEAPTEVTAGTGESQLFVDWDPPDEDLSGYLLFCEAAGIPGVMIAPVMHDDGGLLDGSVAAGGVSTAGGDASAGAASGTGATATTGGTTATGGAGNTTSTPDASAPATTDVECGSTTLVGGERPPAGLEPCGEEGRLATDGTATGLENGQSYAVAVAAIDDVGNVGELSEPVCGTPEIVDSFFELYRRAGGPGGGGFCAASPGLAGRAHTVSAVMIGGLFAAAAAWRRRRQR